MNPAGHNMSDEGRGPFYSKIILDFVKYIFTQL